MTISVSIASCEFIVMTVDSSITRQFTDHREYDEGRKSYFFDGIGCVATWGAREANRVGWFLDRLGLSREHHSVEDLADLVQEYLTCKYRPHELDLDDVGYHVAGFDRKKRARLYDIFWGYDRPSREDQVSRQYTTIDWSPKLGKMVFLYHGRSDIAEQVIRSLRPRIEQGSLARYNPNTPLGRVCFSDFVARFAAEVTPEVGPPFITRLIAPHNSALEIINRTFSPLDVEQISEHVANKMRQLRTNGRVSQ